METQTVKIPAREMHEGYAFVIVKLEWKCPECGKPRGPLVDALSYDGSRRLTVNGWHNACGHVDKYEAVRLEASENGLNVPEGMYWHKASKRALSNPVAMETDDAADVFTVVEAKRGVGLGTFERRYGGQLKESRFTGFCGLPRGRAASVELTPAAENVLRRGAIGDVTMALEVIEWPGEHSLVVAQYGQILGSVWVAFVRTSTVPEGMPIMEYKS